MSTALLQVLAETANETKGCSFTVTRTKDLYWRVTFPNQWLSAKSHTLQFADYDLVKAMYSAIMYVCKHRKELELSITKYEL